MTVALFLSCILAVAIFGWAPTAFPSPVRTVPPAGQIISPSGTPLDNSVVPIVPQVPTEPMRLLTLPDAITMGLQNNFQTRLAALQVATAREQLREAQAGLQPTVSGLASYTLSGTVTVPGANIANQPFVAGGATGFGISPSGGLFELTLTYALYSGGALEAQVRIAQAGVALAEAQFIAAADQVVFSVRRAYYQAQASEASVQAAQHSVEAAQEDVRVAALRIVAGTSPQFDLLQAQVQLASSQQALTAARTASAQAQQNLAAALVLPLETTFTPMVPPELREVPQDVRDLIRQALQNRPEIAQALASARAVEGAIDLAYSGLKPNIIASVGPQLVTGIPVQQQAVTWTGTIALTVPLFDGGLTAAKVNEARHRFQSAKVTEEQTRQQVELDVRNAYLALGNAAETLRSALVGRAAAQEALRVANVRFRAGVGTQLEVVTAVQNAATADSSVIQTTLNYGIAVAQLDLAIGVQVRF